MNSYEEQWDTLQQGRKKIKEYVDDFQRLQAKVDPGGNLPAPTVLKKFVRGLAPKIAPLVYATNPANIAAAIDSATRIATGFEINTENSKINNIEEEEKDKIAELREQIANLALVEQIKAEKQKNEKDN